MDKFKNKYRITSHRKPNWDYSADALYFLTIVTHNRVCNLGAIVNNEMILSDFGAIVEKEWFKSFDIRNELLLHDFILMPNHLHSIVEIYNKNRGDVNGGDVAVETHGRVSLPIEPIEPIQPIQLIEPIKPIQPTQPIQLIELEMLPIKRNPPVRLPKSISSFIAGLKSAVNTKTDDFIDEQNLLLPKYNRNNHFFQPNYHDHIIRNNFEYQNIKNYIANNPMNWKKDTFYV